MSARPSPGFHPTTSTHWALGNGVYQRDVTVQGVKMPIARQQDDDEDDDDVLRPHRPEGKGDSSTSENNFGRRGSPLPGYLGSTAAQQIQQERRTSRSISNGADATTNLQQANKPPADKRSFGGWTQASATPGTISPSPLAFPSATNGAHPRTVDSSSTSRVDSPTVTSPQQSAPPPKKPVLSEFAREMEHKFGRPNHGFAKLTVVKKPYFENPNLAHLLHRPQLKQYYRWKNNVLVRQNYERKAHWNELFFDLVFICVFQRVAHELHNSEHLDGRALTEFSVLFCAAWKIWFDLTVYVNQFDPTDTLHKVYFLMQMIFVMGLAVMSIKGVIGSYLAGTGLTLLLRCWSAYYCPRARQDAYVQVVIWVAAAVPWLVALGVKPPSTVDHAHAGSARADYAQFELWAIGLAIAFGGQFLAQCHPRFHIPLNIEHITERFGIFTILCMGEPIVNVMFTDFTATRDSFTMAVLGGVMIFAVQILYYDVDGFNHKMHALRNTRFRGYLWALLHCPFHATIIISSVTFNFFVDSTLKLPDIPERDNFNAQYAAAAAGQYTGTAVEAFELGHAAMEQSVIATEHGLGAVQLIDTTHRQLFCVANGSMLAILFFIAMLHVPREGHIIQRRWRMLGRACGTLAFLLLHLFGDRISPVGMFLYGGICLGLIAIIDTFGNFVPHIKKKPNAYAVAPPRPAGVAPASGDHVIAMGGEKKSHGSGNASARSTLGTQRSALDVDESAFTPEHSVNEAEPEPSVISRAW
jgi:low temperature requirement protein LtrA